jgi:predicted transcriptional regulator
MPRNSPVPKFPISTTLGPTLHAALARLATAMDCSYAEILREALVVYLAHVQQAGLESAIMALTRGQRIVDEDAWVSRAPTPHGNAVSHE